MTLKIGVLKESNNDKRVALTPSSVASLLKQKGIELLVEEGVGGGIWIKDEEYYPAKVLDYLSVCYSSDLILRINPPTEEELVFYKEGTTLVTQLYPKFRPNLLSILAEKKINCFALERIPRIFRSQGMDVLSSQSTIIGYKSVLIAANAYQSFFPKLITAAGTIDPAKVLVVGVGVAGLQAIATARRLGARVFAYDVRVETKEQAESLGAEFINTGIEADTRDGYARNLTEAERNQQITVLEKYLATCDIVIATAGVPGGKAPKILTKEMLEKMSPGSVVVDTLADMGGNCELTKVGVQVFNGVTLIGMENLPGELAKSASEMYSKNVVNFINLVNKGGRVDFDLRDEIISTTLVTYRGYIRI